MHSSIQPGSAVLAAKKTSGIPFLKRGSALIVLTLAGFAFSPIPPAAAVSPAPDGGYTGDNTAEGTSALNNLTTGINNTAIGSHVLFYTTTGKDNTGVGFDSLLVVSSAVQNTAVGSQTLVEDTTGSNNTAVGFQALTANQTAHGNTALGSLSLASNTGGSANTAAGIQSLTYNTTGNYNAGFGAQALFLNTTGNYNTALGTYTLNNSTTGGNNTASGYTSLHNNTTGNNNTANGVAALYYNTTGLNNSATGLYSLWLNTTGNNNVANGANALKNNNAGSNNTAVGVNALLNNNGLANIGIGNSAGSNLTSGNNNIAIGNVGVAGDSSTTRIGTVGMHKNVYIPGISGVTVAGGVAVVVDATGHLGTVTSSARFKDEIKPMDKASESILALKPVTFRYKQELDSEGVPQFGLIAEQVEKVNPDLVARDADGKVYTVRYEAVNAMLLNEFLKEHQKVEALDRKGQAQEATIAQQQKDIQALMAAVKEQAAQLQKVNARLDAERPTPQVAANNQ